MSMCCVHYSIADVKYPAEGPMTVSFRWNCQATATAVTNYVHICIYNGISVLLLLLTYHFTVIAECIVLYIIVYF